MRPTGTDISSIMNHQWFRCYGKRESPIGRLFCFSYAGAGASMFRTWPALLPSDLELVAVQLPGREDRLKEPPARRLSILVSSIGEQMQPLLDKPFSFFGHSMGAILAFELARYLRDTYAKPPFHLIVSGRKAPHLHAAPRNLYALPQDQLLAKLKELGGTDLQVFDHPEMLELVLPVLRADFEICETYEYIPGAPLPSVITALGGTEDSETPQPHLEEWRQHGTGGFSLHMLPGNHFFINSARLKVLQVIAAKFQPLIPARRPPIRSTASSSVDYPST